MIAVLDKIYAEEISQEQENNRSENNSMVIGQCPPVMHIDHLLSYYHFCYFYR